jgi:hypothetical protein
MNIRSILENCGDEIPNATVILKDGHQIIVSEDGDLLEVCIFLREEFSDALSGHRINGVEITGATLILKRVDEIIITSPSGEVLEGEVIPTEKVVWEFF